MYFGTIYQLHGNFKITITMVWLHVLVLRKIVKIYFFPTLNDIGYLITMERITAQNVISVSYHTSRSRDFLAFCNQSPLLLCPLWQIKESQYQFPIRQSVKESPAVMSELRMLTKFLSFYFLFVNYHLF